MQFTYFSRAGEACHVTIPADDKPHETEQQAYVGVTVEVVSGCRLNVLLLAIKKARLGYGRIGRCTVYRKQHNVGWHNAVDTGIFTRLSCVNAFGSFHQ